MTLQYDYKIIERGCKTLFIFPDKPFWFVGDCSIKYFLECFDNKITMTELESVLLSNFEYEPTEIMDVFNELEALFFEASLFDKAQKEMYKRDINDQFAIPVLNVTKNCNLACRHCYADAKFSSDKEVDNELTTEEWKKIIFDIAKLVSTRGENRMLMTGGEPFLRSDIIELIEYISEIGFRPLINTNGLLIKDEYIDKLKKSKVELLISLDGSKENIHEFIRGKNTFLPTLSKIKKLKENDIITRLSFTVHEGNFDDIKDYVELARLLCIEDIAINNLTILSRASKNGLKRIDTQKINEVIKNLTVKDKDYNKYLNTTDYAKQGAILLENFKFSYCGIGSASLCIDSNGDVYPCYNTMIDQFKVGNVLETSLNDLWTTSNVLNELRNLNVDTMNDKCSQCIVRYYCGGGCRGEAFFFTNDIKSPYPFCNDMITSIIDLMFNISYEDELFSNKVDYFRRLKEKYVEH